MKLGYSFFLFLGTILMGQQMMGQTRIYVNEYLNIGVGGRGLAMSGAQTASTGDVYSGYWNPAGLVFMKDFIQVGGMHAEYFSGISKYDYLGFAIQNKQQTRALGFSFIRFATDDIPYTLDYVRPDGSFDESKLRGFSAGDYAGLITLSQKVDFLSNEKVTTALGGNAKIIYRNVGSMANAWGVGVDLGIQSRWKKFSLGLAMKDVTTTYTSWSFNLTEDEKRVFGNTGNEIPIKSYEIMNPRFNVGGAYNILSANENFDFIVELGLDMTTDGKRRTILSGNKISLDPRFGFEVGYKDNIYLRGGLSNFYYVHDNNDITHTKKYLMYQPTVGVGFKILSINIDYSFSSLQAQSAPLMSHIFSLRIDLNRMTAPEPTQKGGEQEGYQNTDQQQVPPVSPEK